MNVQVKSSNGITLVPMDTRMMANRRIFVTGEIDQEAACEFAKQVMYLAMEDGERPIHVYINSPGGDVSAGLMMYDVIQASPVPVRMYCLGSAFSMAAVLFASGRYGRYMLPNSELMLHEPLLGQRVAGNASSIRSISESLMEVKRKVNRLLAAHTGKTEGEIEEASRYDHYFSAKEAVDFGLADRIMTFEQMMKE